MRWFLMGLLVACGGKDKAVDAAASAPGSGSGSASGSTPASEVVAASAPETPPPPSTPAELFAACGARLENPQAAGECTTDADCARAGCSQEVCTTVAGAKSIMSTCEDKLCFKVLDTCGCHEGACTWTLKAEMPPVTTPKALPNSLPSSLPPSGTATPPQAP